MANSVMLDTAKLDQIISAVANNPTRTYTIADGVNYGLFVELSTSKMAAQPFLVPAFEQVTRGLVDALQVAIEAGQNLDPILSKAALDIQAMAQRNAPVDTGTLKGSLHVEIS